MEYASNTLHQRPEVADIPERPELKDGGRGYMRENVAERFFRELRVDRIWEGASEIQRLIIANGLLKRGAGSLVG